MRSSIVFSFLVLPLLLTACWPGTSFLRGSPPTCAQEQIEWVAEKWQTAWSVRVEDGYISAPPFIAKDYVIVIERSFRTPSLATLHAFQIKTGEEVWVSNKITVGYDAARVHTTTYFATYEVGMGSVIDLSTGTRVLGEKEAFPSLYALTVDDHALYWHDFYGHIRATSLQTGELLWEQFLPEVGKGNSLFVTADKRLIVDALSGLLVLDPSTGAVIENFPANSFASPELYTDSLLVGDANLNDLKAVSIETGETVWEHPYRPFIPYESPTLYNGKLYFIGEKVGDMAFYPVYAMSVSLADGGVVFKSEAEDGIEILSGIKVLDETGYAIFEDGTLRSIDLENGEISQVLHSDALSYWRNTDNPYFPIPGLTASDEYLIASFGCSTLYAFRPLP